MPGQLKGAIPRWTETGNQKAPLLHQRGRNGADSGTPLQRDDAGGTVPNVGCGRGQEGRADHMQQHDPDG